MASLSKVSWSRPPSSDRVQDILKCCLTPPAGRNQRFIHSFADTIYPVCYQDIPGQEVPLSERSGLAIIEIIGVVYALLEEFHYGNQLIIIIGQFARCLWLSIRIAHDIDLKIRVVRCGNRSVGVAGLARMVLGSVSGLRWGMSISKPIVRAATWAPDGSSPTTEALTNYPA